MSSERSFGRVVVEFRNRRGMTRSQLAERAELSYPYVSQIETGLRKPSRKAAAKLAEALGVSAFDLEAAIPRDDTDDDQNRRASAAADTLISGEPMVLAAMVSPALERTSGSWRPSSREDLVAQIVDLLEEVDVQERLDVLADVQKLAMRRLIDRGGAS